MATTLDQYMPYDSGPGANVTEDGWRKFMKHLRGDGVIRGFLDEFVVFGDSTGRQVKVKAGECWIQGNWGQLASQKTLSIAANSSGNPRIDRVILRNDFSNNRIEVDVLTGTPAGTPVAPAVTQNTTKWEISLALVAVANGAATITAGNVTDYRTFIDGSCRYTVDSGLQTVATSTDTRIDFDLPKFQSSEVELPSIREFRLKRAGMWMIVLNVVWDSNTTGARTIWIKKQGATARLSQQSDQAIAGLCQNIVAIDRFSVDDIVECYANQNSGSGRTLSDSLEGTNVAFWWLGP